MGEIAGASGSQETGKRDFLEESVTMANNTIK